MLTICLCMIVKNEENVIERCIDSVKHLVDTYVICDTGSTDNTIDAARKAFGDTKGIIVENNWVDFSTNRNKALSLVPDWVDYILLLDADMTVEHENNIKDILDTDVSAYMIKYTGDLKYRQKLLIQNKMDYKYMGVTHEYISTPKETETIQNLNSLTVTHHGDGGSRKDKFIRDWNLLSAEYDKNPHDTRTVYYLARTAECLRWNSKAIKLFKERASMGGWEEEAWHAQYSAAKLQKDTVALMAAWDRRPHRIEPLYEAVQQLRKQKAYRTAHLLTTEGLATLKKGTGQDVLFIEKPAYDWGLLFEHAINSWYVGKKDVAIEANQMLLNNPDLPQNIRNQVTENLKFT